MIEIVSRTMLHADFLHYSPRCDIGWNREGNNLPEPNGFETELQGFLSCLRCISSIPVFRRYSPTDFNARREMRFEERDIETNESDEWCEARNFHRPGAKPVCLKVGLDMIYQRVAFLKRQKAWEVLHNTRVRVHSSELLTVCNSPLPQQEPLRVELIHRFIPASPQAKK
jgi:hypothetical protein